MTDKRYASFSKALLKQPKPVALALMHYVERHPKVTGEQNLFHQAAIEYLEDLRTALSIMMSELGGDNDDKSKN